MSEFSQIEYSEEHDSVIAFHSIHIQSGTCHICKADTDVIVVDPEQSGYGIIPMCQSCINRLFETLKQERMIILTHRLSEMQEEINKLYRGR